MPPLKIFSAKELIKLLKNNGYKEVRQKLVWNMRNKYREEYEYSKIALQMYNNIKEMGCGRMSHFNIDLL